MYKKYNIKYDKLHEYFTTICEQNIITIYNMFFNTIR